ncbi:hypothetical protein UCRPA7_457 [Phaeoacremonium minimum UCRPA7]|uniref:Uncharacterized protein n=1 Tax=Phaeoacremonium minimum (strain UCR-PA7) TaxID=1286976 RepID=R8BWW6_PHAM7|nr:hypothetical protein UCRPA7_457 [Phaeoacremonium minimum UCRPA7]EOO03856.1 hypothetical protein UCRPA7_457 [Phaeoacremonium minimum UCRPA7]
MKFSGILAGAFATLAVAAPTKEVEARTAIDLSLLNGLSNFNAIDIQYLNVINSLDLQLLNTLAVNNNFNSLAFQGLFQNNVFDLNSILQLQQLQTLLQFANLGVFNQFDLASLQLQQLQLGLVSGIGGFDFSSIIDQSLVPQITAIAQQTVVVAKE